jgi:hypothetical protein
MERRIFFISDKNSVVFVYRSTNLTFKPHQKYIEKNIKKNFLALKTGYIQL